ncbi:MAG: PEP-CTERM sorting domain-containing protein [Gammaproteobacteria bacterium]
MIRSNRSPLVAATCALLLSPAAFAETIAFDMVGSASQNLVAYTNAFTDAFSSPGDGFQIYQRGVSGSIPFAVLDDSAVGFPADSLGIITEANTDTFFGITDTVNGDNSGPVTAQWDFDVAGVSDMMLSLDMGAMGDFETSDFFSISYSIDGGAVETLFDAMVDESLSQEYILADGDAFDLNDPMTVAGTILTNELQTLSAAILGEGSILSIFLTASTNGGSEAFAFQNLIVDGTRAAVSEPGVLALIGLALVGFGASRRRS